MTRRTLPWDSKRTVEADSGKYVREASADLYHTFRWAKLSRAFRDAHPLCEECRKRGVIKAAQVTDHIVPYPVCGDFFDVSNLQALCEDCNRAKGNRDKKLIAEWRRSHQEM